MRNFLSKKTKTLAIILSILVVLCSVISVSGATGEESEVAPLVYNAWYDYFNVTKAGTTTNEQNGPWYYEYKTDADNTDWILLGRFDGNSWMTASSTQLGQLIQISRQNIMQMYYKQTNDGKTTTKNGALAYRFVSPKDGYISMLETTAKVNSSKDGKYNALIRITVTNSEGTRTVYPSTGDYATVNYVADNEETTENEHTNDKGLSIDAFGFNVNEGDAIRFEMRPDKELEVLDDYVTVKWNPSFYLYNEKEIYTSKSEGILGKLTKFMRGIFSGVNSSTMDNTATDTQKQALNKAKLSNNGVYSVYNSIYGENQFLMTDDSLWKFGVETDYVPEFDTQNISDITFTAAKADGGVEITPSQSGVFNVIAVKDDGSSRNYVVSGSSFVIPTTDITLPFKAQIKYGTRASKIYNISEDANADEFSVASSKILLTDVDNTTDGVIKVSGSAESSYDIYYSRETDAPERAVKFNAKRGEKMRLGFVVPYAGQYEISAPISVEGNADVYYTTVYEGANPKILTPLTKYTNADSLCKSQLYLSAGDVIWFEAYSLADTVINIGIPRVTSIERETGGASNNEIYFSYPAIEYLENRIINGYTYADVTATDKVKDAWSFGYFGADKALNPYTFIKDGYYYTVTDAGNQNTAGTIYPTLSDNTVIASKNSYNPSKIFGSVNSTTGVYMQFIAPMGGNGTLALTDGINTISDVNLTVMKNGEIFETYENGVAAGTVIDFGVLAPNDVITLMYEGTATTCYLGTPVIKIGGANVVSINFKNAEGAPLYNVRAAALKMPALKGYSGLCSVAWEKDGKEYKVGDEYTVVAGSNDFTAKYRYYGDIDGDDAVTADFAEDGTNNDYARLSEIILDEKAKTEEWGQAAISASDIKTDGQVNIGDLLKLRKFIEFGSYECN